MLSPILFLTPPFPDYMGVGMLHGLRTLLGARLIDWPKYNCAYDDYELSLRENVYGRGFTAFFDLHDEGIDRSQIQEKIVSGFFQIIIFADIANQTDLFLSLYRHLRPDNTVLIDGQDTGQVVPHAGKWWRHPSQWLALRGIKNYLYYKREWTEDSQFNLWHRAIPPSLRSHLPFSRKLRPLSFSIPECKILAAPTEKKKMFPLHIVDPEVAWAFPDRSTSYAFTTEQAYYQDLQESKFGITIKRAGWDCMRHYEIAANGSVPCFRRISEKPKTCAPYGLVHGENCVEYRDAQDLLHQTSCIGDDDYQHLQSGAMEWVRRQSTVVRARQFLDSLSSAGIFIE